MLSQLEQRQSVSIKGNIFSRDCYKNNNIDWTVKVINDQSYAFEPKRDTLEKMSNNMLQVIFHHRPNHGYINTSPNKPA